MADILKPLTTIHDKLTNLEAAAEDAGADALARVKGLHDEADGHFAKADAAFTARTTLASALGIGKPTVLADGPGSTFDTNPACGGSEPQSVPPVAKAGMISD